MEALRSLTNGLNERRWPPWAHGGLHREKFIVQHSNWLQPEDYLRFIHFDGFTSDWKDLRLDDDDLRILQVQIMISPLAGKVIPGTGGLRKMRFGPPSRKQGRRGGVRVLYALYPEHSVAVLAAAYEKSEQEDIRPADKKALKSILEEIDQILDEERGTEK